jgi:hypothetical protein
LPQAIPGTGSKLPIAKFLGFFKFFSPFFRRRSIKPAKSLEL